jgi:hypothetical protein
MELDTSEALRHDSERSQGTGQAGHTKEAAGNVEAARSWHGRANLRNTAAQSEA